MSDNTVLTLGLIVAIILFGITISYSNWDQNRIDTNIHNYYIKMCHWYKGEIRTDPFGEPHCFKNNKEISI